MSSGNSKLVTICAFVAAVASLVCVILVLSIWLRDSPKASDPPIVTSPKAPNPPIVTLDEFNQLQIGMTYEKAKEIIGAEGALMTESRMTEGKVEGYQWDNSDGSNAMLVFHNGKIIVKSQVKLR